MFVCEFIYSEEKMILVLGSFCWSLTTENHNRSYVYMYFIAVRLETACKQSPVAKGHPLVSTLENVNITVDCMNK